MVESMGGITLGTSQLDLGVRLSPHPAPDILSRGFCPSEITPRLEGRGVR